MNKSGNLGASPGAFADGGKPGKIVKMAILPLLVLVSTLGLTAACSQMPTERRSLVEQRPQISFKTDSERALAARIELDGQDAGRLADYLEGEAAMRLRPGSHVLRIWHGDEILFNERLYLVEGAQRTILVR